MQKGNLIKVPVTGQVIEEEEVEALKKVAENKQFAPAEKVKEFEHNFARYVGKMYGIFVNSGSSANLLAVTAYKKYINESLVTLPALMFPTTLNPYLQNNYDVELIDVDIETLQPQLPQKHGVHTLGNYSDISGIEDSCDALFPGNYKGIIQTFSFFPAHFLSCGEGGMVTTDNDDLYKLMESFAHWGKDCFCPLGYDNACGKRFDQQFGEMPYGYDHKYIYSNIGYNLAGTEMGAAIGIEQLKKLPRFLEIRKHNFTKLYQGLNKYSDVFIMPKTVLPDTAWFSFPITIRKETNIRRRDLVQFLDSKGVGSRPIMGGNLKRQPAYSNIPFIVKESLHNSDLITENSFYVGIWHGLKDEQIEYTISVISEFIENHA